MDLLSQFPVFELASGASRFLLQVLSNSDRIKASQDNHHLVVSRVMYEIKRKICLDEISSHHCFISQCNKWTDEQAAKIWKVHYKTSVSNKWLQMNHICWWPTLIYSAPSTPPSSISLLKAIRFSSSESFLSFKNRSNRFTALLSRGMSVKTSLSSLSLGRLTDSSVLLNTLPLPSWEVNSVSVSAGKKKRTDFKIKIVMAARLSNLFSQIEFSYCNSTFFGLGKTISVCSRGHTGQQTSPLKHLSFTDSWQGLSETLSHII